MGTNGRIAINGKINGSNGKADRLRRAALRWRTSHLVTGFVVGLWLVFMAFSGVLVNHQTDWGLDEVEVSNRYLPAGYADEFHPESTRFNVILSDLHSGAFFGTAGRYISDLVALLVLISVFSGFQAYRLRKKSVALCLEACDIGCLEVERAKQEAVGAPLPAKLPVVTPELASEREEPVEEVANAR
jgi:hypothetical protein